MSGEPFTVRFEAERLGIRVADSRPPVIQTFIDVDGEPGSAEKTGTVHTRTQSFDAGEMGAPPTCAAARSLALRLPWFSRPLCSAAPRL